MNKATRYAPEVRERAVRLVFEHQGEHDSQARGQRALTELHGVLSHYYLTRRLSHTRFPDIVAIPEMADDVVGLAALEHLAERLVPDA